MRTELHHHHHHHQVPTCGIKHQVLHRTHLKKKKVISRFISEILPYCVQNMLVSSDHPTSFCAAATQLWKDTRSLSVFQGCHYSPSLHLPKRHINNFNREKKQCRTSIISIFDNLEQNLHTTSSIHLLWNLCNKPYS